MDAIVNKIHKDLIELAISYQGENATQRLSSEFRQAIFFIIPEQIRTKDMEQSAELREEMIAFFEDNDPTKPGTPYIGQLKEQDSCYAARKCKFEFGQTLYQCTSCRKHFVCEGHKTSTCMLCVASKKKEKSPKSTGERKVNVKATGNREDNKNTVNNNAHREEEDAERGDKDAESGDEDAVSGDEDADANSNDKCEDESESGNVDSGGKGTHCRKSASINKDTDEKEDLLPKGKENDRTAKFQVEDIRNLSMDDFKFEPGILAELQVCQVPTKSGKLVWVVVNDYVQLKEEYVNNKANSDGDESEGSEFGWKNSENADIGK
ncbi:hypothetical protein BU23DRAFT_574669 [Bimuria novae-zelandiae CBS 107.79]|uniref:Uncharacterized protein n=1 Tax=Bimuria novae-zelandiae CBS 107.79 TaxID=1447943 RepID=A0A6A5UXE2_9PLEO|nr:hypothetical protein BU23DRAFT_574669 [Bimuria novae-zelandiae CBS 107.79]